MSIDDGGRYPALGTKQIINALCLEWMRRILLEVFVIVVSVFAFLLVGGAGGRVKSFGFLGEVW